MMKCLCCGKRRVVISQVCRPCMFGCNPSLSPLTWVLSVLYAWGWVRRKLHG